MKGEWISLLSSLFCGFMCLVKRSEFSCGHGVAYICRKFSFINFSISQLNLQYENDMKVTSYESWIFLLVFPHARVIEWYMFCCYMFCCYIDCMEEVHRKSSTRVKNTTFTSTWRHSYHFCNFFKCVTTYEYFHSAKLLSQILWYKRYLFLLLVSFKFIFVC